MDNITQGSVVGGMRCDKYPDISCLGVIINARCDLAQEKTNKYYYLIAIPMKSWLFSQVGYKLSMKTCIKNLAGNLKNKLEEAGVEWNDLQYFSAADFETVITSEVSMSLQKDLINKFKKYAHYTSKKLMDKEKSNIFRENEKSIQSFFRDMSNGKNVHFVLLPRSAFEDKSIHDDYIVDLQELNYFTASEIVALRNLDIDCKNIKLSQKQKNEYNLKFMLNNEPGYSCIENVITSPWVEYIVQHFSNLFTRVGVDNYAEEDIKGIVNKMIYTEENI